LILTTIYIKYAEPYMMKFIHVTSQRQLAYLVTKVLPCTLFYMFWLTYLAYKIVLVPKNFI